MDIPTVSLFILFLATIVTPTVYKGKEKSEYAFVHKVYLLMSMLIKPVGFLP